MTINITTTPDSTGMKVIIPQIDVDKFMQGYNGAMLYYPFKRNLMFLGVFRHIVFIDDVERDFMLRDGVFTVDAFTDETHTSLCDVFTSNPLVFMSGNSVLREVFIKRWHWFKKPSDELVDQHVRIATVRGTYNYEYTIFS